MLARLVAHHVVLVASLNVLVRPTNIQIVRELALMRAVESKLYL